jgi:acyl-CoA thioester hydrolase
MEEILETFPVIVEIPVAWGEMDAFQHVNNIVYFRYLESARIAYFDKLQLMEYLDRTGVGPILASTRCRFKVPLTYPDKVSVGIRVSEIEQDRFTMDHVVFSHRLRKVAAEGQALIVCYNYREHKKTPIPEEWRQKILETEGHTAQ